MDGIGGIAQGLREEGEGSGDHRSDVGGSRVSGYFGGKWRPWYYIGRGLRERGVWRKRASFIAGESEADMRGVLAQARMGTTTEGRFRPASRLTSFPPPHPSSACILAVFG